jgi:hypothetical protein
MLETERRGQDPGVIPSDGWAGWVTFAAVMLILMGSLDVFQGLVALFDDGYFLAPSDDGLLLVDYTAWGIVLLAWGAILLLAGFGLLRTSGWARWFAIVVVFVNTLLQVGFLAAYPIWSAMIVAIGIFVIFALTARWSEARAAMR